MQTVFYHGNFFRHPFFARWPASARVFLAFLFFYGDGRLHWYFVKIFGSYFTGKSAPYFCKDSTYPHSKGVVFFPFLSKSHQNLPKLERCPCMLQVHLWLLSGKNWRLSSIFDSCWRNEDSNFCLRKFAEVVPFCEHYGADVDINTENSLDNSGSNETMQKVLASIV